MKTTWSFLAILALLLGLVFAGPPQAVSAASAEATFIFTSSPNPSAANQEVTLTLSATGTDPTYPPFGYVYFKDNGAEIPDCLRADLNLSSTSIPVPDSPAVCTTRFTTPGVHIITAEFNSLWTGVYSDATLTLEGGQTVTEPHPLAISPETLPDGVYGLYYEQQLTATCSEGVICGPIDWSLQGQPEWMDVYAYSGVFSGMPAAAGEFTFTAWADDYAGSLGSRTYTWTVLKATPEVTVVEASFGEWMYLSAQVNLPTEGWYEYQPYGLLSYSIDGIPVEGCSGEYALPVQWSGGSVDCWVPAPAGLPAGSHSVQADYTPDASVANFYNGASGTGTLNVPVSVTGLLFNDLDQDGVRDEGEGPVQSYWVYLDEGCDTVIEHWVNSDYEGHFSFETVILDATYCLVVEESGNWVLTTPAPAPFVADGTNYFEIGLHSTDLTFTIAGTLFDDGNQNGARDEGEDTLYFSGQVYLDQGCDESVEYTAWLQYGGYAFFDIPEGGCYRIIVELEESVWQQTTQLEDFGLSGNTTVDIGFYYPDIAFSPGPSELPAGNVGVEYYQQFTASGGAEPYTYQVFESNLPDGLTLTEDAGGPVLSGTPTVAGYYGFTLLAADANGAVGAGEYQLIIKTDGDFSFTASPNPSAPGEAVTFSVSAAAGAAYPAIPPVGLVTFAVDGTPIEGCSDLRLNLGIDPNGEWSLGDYPATCTTAALDAGTHTITAIYIDDLGIGIYNTPTLALSQQVGQPSNTAPTANPGGPYLGPINTAIAFDGSGSSDPDGDPLTYAWTLGDGGTSTAAAPAHTYTSAGIYDVCLTVHDGSVDSAPACTLAVVYDPAGGFVTGGGWIDSPAGAYLPDPSLGGKATFGFVSKYRKGASLPTGNTEFQFEAGQFKFHSIAYDWLVVSKDKIHAQFKGSGLVNGALDPNGNAYKFMLWAGDGSGANGADTFRIRIWWESADGVEHEVYDNGFDQVIGGGSIVVHTGK